MNKDLFIPNYFITESKFKICLINLPTETISIGITTNIGALVESDDEFGIAHFLEHMMFSNTQNRTEVEINEIIDNLGALTNARTTFDNTLYYAKGNYKYSLDILDIILDIFLNPNFTDEAIAREKTIVLQELKNREMEPNNLTHLRAMEKIFTGRKKYPVIGNEETINNITKEKLMGFFKKHYKLENSTIVISGKFNKTPLLKYMKDLLKSDIIMHKITFNKLKKDAIINNFDNLNQIEYIYYNNPQYIISFHFPGVNSFSEWKYHYEILSEILSGFSTSLLYQKLRNDLGATYSISSGLIDFNDLGYFILTFNCTNETLLQCIQECLKIFKSLSTTPIGKDLLYKAKNSIKSSILYRFEDMHTYYYMMLEALRLNIEAVSPQKMTEYIDRIKPQTLLNLCKNVLAKKNILLIIQGPTDETENINKLFDKY